MFQVIRGVPAQLARPLSRWRLSLIHLMTSSAFVLFRCRRGVSLVLCLVRQVLFIHLPLSFFGAANLGQPTPWLVGGSVVSIVPKSSSSCLLLNPLFFFWRNDFQTASTLVSRGTVISIVSFVKFCSSIISSTHCPFLAQRFSDIGVRSWPLVVPMPGSLCLIDGRFLLLQLSPCSSISHYWMAFSPAASSPAGWWLAAFWLSHASQLRSVAPVCRFTFIFSS
jgi:hypothetical protein